MESKINHTDRISIGGKIKKLRCERGLTQDQLAELVGISFQAVSKWENNIALPDITLVPKLASIFNVSIDELFDYNKNEAEADIMSYVERSWNLREKDPDGARALLEEGLAKYPNNELMLNNLLYTVNYSAEPDETIRIASKLTDSGSGEIRYDALRFLAYAYNAKGDEDSAVAALEQVPEIYFTKLSELAFVTTGKRKHDAAEKQKWISFEELLQMMQKLAECCEADGNIDKAVDEIKRAMALLPILGNDSFNIYTDFFNRELSRLGAK